jgi:hypothetical protein
MCSTVSEDRKNENLTFFRFCGPKRCHFDIFDNKFSKDQNNSYSSGSLAPDECEYRRQKCSLLLTPGSEKSKKRMKFRFRRKNIYLQVQEKEYVPAGAREKTSTCRCKRKEHLEAVLRIHDILGWIRIRIRGSMPLTNGS